MCDSQHLSQHLPSAQQAVVLQHVPVLHVAQQSLSHLPSLQHDFSAQQSAWHEPFFTQHDPALKSLQQFASHFSFVQHPEVQQRASWQHVPVSHDAQHVASHGQSLQQDLGLSCASPDVLASAVIKKAPSAVTMFRRVMNEPSSPAVNRPRGKVPKMRVKNSGMNQGRPRTQWVGPDRTSRKGQCQLT